METEEQTIIQFKQVSYADEDVSILKDITGSFYKGKITTLVGPSGAGKTTLIKLCNGLISPSAGEIYIDDKNIFDYEPIELRKTAGIAMQSAVMLSGSVMRNLALPLTLQGEQLAENRAKELLKDVGLEEDFLHKKVRDLSGGQQQKVSIARTLVNQPEVLLLDEITSSLDPRSQQDIETLIKKVNEQYGTTIIWITHNLDQARSIGDYTWVMIDGKVAETGMSSFLDNPENERVGRFVKGEII